ncbi:uncharacterized protein Tco025E_04824 [Trypanosoma conorhini]|uniref:Uncharacterized protein n=1 Tax=Trypanosoma conorhini TaxID=83891 RepID=A0A3R7KYA1_9TRYP|nr:uncharacterized protein Tco025E_04824 [Trypanosoma conorhini]RNF17493.1 hypothetical protein Tco025E_04824 [Trypanosoma conorhini]
MNDDEERELTEALKVGKALLVEGHSGHRLRFYHDALPFLAAKAGMGGERAPVPLLVSSLRRLCSYLRRADLSRRHVFFVNTDLCAFCEVRDALHKHYGAATRLQRLSLRKLHHSCSETLKVLEAFERKREVALAAANFRYFFGDVGRDPLLIPEECGISAFASRVQNSVDATLKAGVVDVRSYCSAWMPDLGRRLWTDTYVFERILPPDPCGDPLPLFRGVVETILKREVTLIDVSDLREGVERMALSLAVSSKEKHCAKELLERVVTGTKRMGWVLVAQTATPSSFDMPQHTLHLWCGAQVVLGDGRMGTVKGFEETSLCRDRKAKWPVVVIDGEVDGNVVLPSADFLHGVLNLRVSELPLRLADTMTAEELFLTPRSLLARRLFVLRPSLFIGHLPRLRCAFASLPSLSCVALTSPLPRNLRMTVATR